ncbi:hypothetical protein OJ998_04930 [Solirubrobacter taibaiensis]|nr:hypothetical protein [Solirubrobacter taibaiensis]
MIGGFRRGQILCIGAASVGAVVIVNLTPTAGGFMSALLLVGVGVALAIVPISGRTLEEWAPVLGAWLRATATGARRYRAAASENGVTSSLDGSCARTPIELPSCLAGCEIAAAATGDRDVGVLHDSSLSALTVVVAVTARAVGLLPTSEHEARLGRWGQVLASLARGGTPIRRLQILQRALPADADGLWRHFLEARDPEVPLESQLELSYTSLLEQAQQVTQDHEILLAIQVDESRTLARAGRDTRAGNLSKREQSHQALLREVRTLLTRFEPVDVEIAGVLSAEQYAAAIRSAYDPFRRADPYEGPERVPSSLSFGPTAADTEWSIYRSEGAVHRTYWVAQWPRLAVGPLFMAPLLLGADAVHSVSLVIEPIPAARSRRAVEAAITSDEADEELRERRGFRTTARRRRQQSAALDREEELASGHEEVRFAGYVTVTARTMGELDDACERVEHAAQQSYLELVPLWGEQDSGFVHGALPLARGLNASRALL